MVPEGALSSQFRARTMQRRTEQRHPVPPSDKEGLRGFSQKGFGLSILKNKESLCVLF